MWSLFNLNYCLLHLSGLAFKSNSFKVYIENCYCFFGPENCKMNFVEMNGYLEGAPKMSQLKGGREKKKIKKH